MSGRLRRMGAAAVLAAASVLLVAAPASAHDYLVGSTPAAGGTVTAPVTSVNLTFDAGVLSFGRGSNGVVVTGPDGAGRHFETGCVRVDGDTVSAPVELGSAGKYTVSWRIVSADGHPVSDAIAFTYRPPAGAAASAGTANGPDCGVSVDTAGGAGAVGAGSSGVVVLVIGVAVGVLLLVAAALVVLVIVLRRTGRDATGGGPPPLP